MERIVELPDFDGNINQQLTCPPWTATLRILAANRPWPLWTRSAKYIHWHQYLLYLQIFDFNLDLDFNLQIFNFNLDLDLDLDLDFNFNLVLNAPHN